jgi:hypothetical protein
MKKFLGLALLASVFTTSAFASIARLEALGEDQYGSQYIDDQRNAFLNAATINDHFDYVTLEHGDTTEVLNEEGTPKAQGGIFRKSGDAVYGIYFGSDSNTAAQLRAGLFSGLATSGALTATEAGVLSQQVQNENTLDLFYGKEASWKWGVKLSHAQAKNEQGVSTAGVTVAEVKKSGTLLGLGAIKGMNEFYANIGLGNELELKEIGGIVTAGGAAILNGNDFHFKGKIGYQLGYVRSLKNNAKAFLEYRAQDVDEKELDSFDETWKIQRIALGWAKTSKLNDAFSAFYKVLYQTETQENRGFTDNSDDWKQDFLKATVGFETQALNWLTVRGSVSNNVFGSTTDTSGDKKTDEATEVRLGATLAFGDFAIDGLIGNDADADGIAGETGDDKGTIRTDSLMSRVSMTYKF